MANHRSILCLDSGSGGLSILAQIVKRLPELSFTYIADFACFPYGSQSPQAVNKRLLEIVPHFSAAYPYDLVVVACNTASTLSLETLRANAKISIVGVVPAVKPGASHSQGNLGILATPLTISGQYLQSLTSKFARNHQLTLIASTRLVEIAEAKITGNIVDTNELRSILRPFIEANCDTVVLACTHFPFLIAEIQLVLGKNVILLESGKAVARRVEFLLNALPPLVSPPLVCPPSSDKFETFHSTTESPSSEQIEKMFKKAKGLIDT